MLATGQHYHKDGVEYEVKSFQINGFKIRMQLIDTSTKIPVAYSGTITNFTSNYSKVPEGQYELIKY